MGAKQIVLVGDHCQLGTGRHVQGCCQGRIDAELV